MPLTKNIRKVVTRVWDLQHYKAIKYALIYDPINIKIYTKNEKKSLKKGFIS